MTCFYRSPDSLLINLMQFPMVKRSSHWSDRNLK